MLLPSTLLACQQRRLVSYFPCLIAWALSYVGFDLFPVSHFHSAYFEINSTLSAMDWHGDQTVRTFA
jgi:hypothetical protein